MVHNLSGIDIARLLEASKSEDFGRIKQSVEDLRTAFAQIENKINDIVLRQTVIGVKVAIFSGVFATLSTSLIVYIFKDIFLASVMKTGGLP